MQFPLLLSTLMQRAGKLFPRTEIVSRKPDGTLDRSNYAEVLRRSQALAAALQREGVERGDRVATLMWNHAGHLEAYFGVPAMGGVLHTLNLRLHPDELAYIVNHAGDRWLLVDDVLLAMYEKFRNKVKLERVIVHRFGCGAQPAGSEDYDALISNGDAPRDAQLDENDAAGMCYTSGTTGQSKGVAYSHRALVLHSFSTSLPDHLNISRHDTMLVAMPMFHANAWGLPYAAVMNGCKIVFPGPNLQPEAILDLLSGEGVTLTGGVPTVWLGVLDALEKEPGRWRLREGMRVAVAGSAAPESLFRRFDKFGVTVIQPWGMTETTPLATFCTLKPHMQEWSDEQKYEQRSKQGLAAPFVEVRAVDDAGEVAWDGATPGELQVRGPWIASSYFDLPEAADKWSADGWLRTGDVVTIDAEGYMKITDRTKDLIKSGGEWISSVDVENALVSHPAVAEAAVVGVYHAKWQERPLAVVVLRAGAAATPEELRKFLSTKFARWQLPDDFVFVSELPHTSTGKLLKSELRKRYADWKWNTPDAHG